MLLRYLILYLNILYGTTTLETTEPVETTSLLDITEVPTAAGDETLVTPTKVPAENCSSETQWLCRDSSECIFRDQTCNGMIDCADGSDEYLDLCEDRESRPMFGLMLHCSYSCGKFHDKLCPQICCHEPQYCYYALIAENGEPNTCRLPSFPEHGKFSVKPYKEEDWSLTGGAPDFWLNYTCDDTYVLVENDRIECLNGNLTKSEKPPYCSEACPLNYNSNYTYMCPKKNENVTCGNYVAINTPVFVTRTEPKPDADPSEIGVALPVLCRADKTYNFSTNCVDEVDDLQKDFENPTMEKMTEYETKFNSFKTNETNQEFESMVNKFHEFEATVKNNLTMMYIKSEQCDITLDLLIWDLTLKVEKQAIQRENEKRDASIVD